jgi:undecaprenyl-diphosphatase
MDFWGTLGGFDRPLFRFVNHAGINFGLDLLMVVFTVIGLSYVLVLLVVPLWMWKLKERAFDVVILIVSSDIISEVLKHVFARPRPFEVLTDVHTLHWDGLTGASGFAFPSGHALRAFAIGVYFLYRMSGRVKLASLSTAVLIGISRIYLGLHWPTDVIAGAVIGALLACVVIILGHRPGRYSVVRGRVVRAVEGWIAKVRTRNVKPSH